MSIGQDNIRDAIRGFANDIHSDREPQQANASAYTAPQGPPPLQHGEHGSLVFHVGDTMYGTPMAPTPARTEPPLSGFASPASNEALAYRPNLPLLMISTMLWCLSILPLYFAHFLPEVPHHWFNGLGFLSLMGAVITTLVGLQPRQR
ncbi:MAG: hypothetical protein VBE63_27195 [Lamprobacter sp.]|uniref:hypothetical protein n=1 Tax=Lamprobacter sp. TaxID=3100796 RepID=UPI002B256B94|nr:hypothetical protein [Lamprobacter sp.]MEA3643585.1 hypothetical protein [Lamprobacter sp.]